MYVCTCVYMYVCMYVCICMRVCMYAYVCVCIHVYVCMHNIWRGIVRGEMSYPKREGIVRGNCPGGKCPGGIVKGRNCPTPQHIHALRRSLTHGHTYPHAYTHTYALTNTRPSIHVEHPRGGQAQVEHCGRGRGSARRGRPQEIKVMAH